MQALGTLDAHSVGRRLDLTPLLWFVRRGPGRADPQR